MRCLCVYFGNVEWNLDFRRSRFFTDKMRRLRESILVSVIKSDLMALIPFEKF